ncbi:MAG: hypothetical protein HZC36_08695 [Armatimonadetes bacterium]|nr:hypothetical protein [Armatimonadota bacterium]
MNARKATFPIAAMTLSVFALGAWQDAALKRSYEKDETNSYDVKVKGQLQGNELSASARYTYKVVKIADNGKASATLSLSQVQIAMGGADQSQEVDPFETTLDGMGLPDDLPTNDAGWVYTFGAFSQIMPSKPLKAGDAFDIDWKNSNKAATIKGKGKLVEFAEMEGVKVAKIEYQVEFSPEDTPTPGRASGTNWIEVATGRCFKAESKVTFEGVFELNVTMARTKRQ